MNGRFRDKYMQNECAPLALYLRSTSSRLKTTSFKLHCNPGGSILHMLLSGIAVMIVSFTGCGGSSSTNQSTIPIQAPSITSANHTSFVEGTAGSFQVSATGTPVPTINESGSLPSGVIFSAGTLSGTPTVNGTFQLTFTAQNGVVPNANQNFTLTVNPPAPLPLSITTTSVPNATVGTAYTATLTASGGVPPYTWNANGGLPSGLTLSSSGTISGDPAGTGTSTFAVSVSDSENPIVTVSAKFAITVSAQNPCSNDATLSGPYAMMLAGWADSSVGNVFGGVIGSFYADGNGNITKGTVDMNSWFGPTQDTFTGTYCISPTNFNLGIMTITPVTYPNPRTLAFALQPDGNGNVLFFDTNADFCSGCGLGGFHGSGVLRKQQTTPFSTGEISGSYAFGFSGADGGAPSLAEAGVITTDGNGNIVGGEYDLNSGGTVTTGSVVPAGSAYTVQSNGRGTATIISTTSSPVSLVFYVVDPSEVLFLQDNSPVIAGRGLLQSGSFSNSSLNGNMVIGIEEGQAEAEAGLLTADGSGSFSYGMDVNSNGGWGSAPGTGTYLVASNGRVQLSNIGTSSAAPVAYLVNQNKAFLVGTDANVAFGKIEPQSGSNFSNASLNGSFTGGSEQPAGPVAGEEVDFIGFSTTSGIATGADDQIAENSQLQYSPSSNVAICPANSCTYNVSSDGRVVLTNGVQQTIIYMISPSQFIALTTGLGNMSNLTNPSTFPFLVDFGQ